MKSYLLSICLCLLHLSMLAQTAPKHIQAALTAYNNEDFSSAINLLEESLLADSINLEDSAQIYFYLGQSHIEQFRQDSGKQTTLEPIYEADSLLRLSLERSVIGPYSEMANASLLAIPTLFQLAGVHAYNQERYTFALNAFKEGIERKSNSPSLWLYKAYTQEKMGDKSYIESYETVRRIDPNHIEALSRIGQYHFNKAAHIKNTLKAKKARKLKKQMDSSFALAEEVFKKLVELDTDNPLWKKQLQQLEGWETF